MLNCPSCQAPLSDDFGLVDCPQCGAALYIEFDGQVKRREEPGTSATVVTSVATAEEPVEENFDFSAPDAAIPQTQVVEQKSGETQLFSHEVLQQEEAPAELSFSSETSEPIEESPAPPMALAEPVQLGGDVMQELVDYGNSSLSSGKDGAFLYNVTVKGIDTADMRATLKELLNDKAFLWDIDDLLKGIRQGELHLKQITPVKASLVVTRLRALPLQISWVQHGLGET